jgi:hypothetical protein
LKINVMNASPSSRKTIVQIIAMIGAAGLGLAAGWALRGNFFNSGNPENLADAAPSLQHEPGKSQKRPGARLQDNSTPATELERHLSTASGATRWLYWMEALEKAQLADFPRLARLAEKDPTAARLLAERWIELDPRHLFDTIAAASKRGVMFPHFEAIEMLFREWPRRDPEGLITALNQDRGLRDRWGFQVADIIMRTDVERGLRLFREWHIVGFGPRMNGVAPWAAKDPRHAAEFIFQNPLDSISSSAIAIVGNEWAKQDPNSALEFAAAQPGELGTVLGGSAMKEWTKRDFHSAGSWLAAAAPQSRSRFSSSFVEAWAKEDAPGALAWCEQHLTGTSLAASVTGAVKGLAATDIGRAKALVADMQPSHARAEAAVVVARDLFPKNFSNESMNPQTVAWLASLDSDAATRVLRETDLRWKWIESDPQSMALFLSSLPNDKGLDRADTDLAREMARKNPGAAMEWASTLPGERRLSAGAAAFSHWFGAQPSEGSQWLRALPPDDPRREPFFENAIRSLAYELRAADVIATMPPSERHAARGIIEKMSLAETRRSLLLEALKP